MKWNVGTKLGVGFGLALLIMVAVGIVSYRATTQLIAASDERKKSYDIVVGLTEIFSLVKDLQSGQRGYVITGDENYLEPYNQALPLISGTISELRALIKDNQYQQALLIRLEPLINERMELSRQIIDARRAEGLEAASLLIKPARGKPTWIKRGNCSAK